MANLRVLIVGASVAGPTAAYWFAKAGARVTVIERFAQLRSSGHNVDIRTTGVTVMRRMPGMEAAVRDKRAPVEGFSIVDDNGRPFGVIRATGDPDKQAILSEYEIFRGDLARILYDLTKDNDKIKYVFGEQVVSIDRNQEGIEDGPVTVEFANGFATSEYDLVVACDGAMSRTRGIGFSCNTHDHIRPGNCWSAYVTIDEDLIAGSKVGFGHGAVGGRFFGITPNMIKGNRVWLTAFYPRKHASAITPFREASKQGNDALKAFVSQHFSDAGWKIDKVLKHMMESDEFYASEAVQVKISSLSKGRVVLVGDAGYAPGFTGTGTSLALTGAYLLAGEIFKHRGDVAAGLNGYETRMRPIIDEMQKVPPFTGSFIAPQSAWALRLRNSLFGFIAWTNILEYAQKIFGGAATSSPEKFNLPEYEWVI